MLSPCPLYRNQLISLSLCRVLHLLVVLTPLSPLCVVSNFVLLLLLSTYQWQITKQVTRLDSQPNPTDWTELSSTQADWPALNWTELTVRSIIINELPNEQTPTTFINIKQQTIKRVTLWWQAAQVLIPCRSCGAKLYINLMDVSSQVAKIYI